MKQIIQNLSNGQTTVADVPRPSCAPRHVLIRSAHSLVSLGTERMLVEFGRANVLEKARQQPDKVKMVLEKARNEGVGATLEAVRSKLNLPIPMGYCNAGTVLERGDHDFAPGERVVSNGPHAEVVCVSRNLVARVPDAVPLEDATFTPVAAIALQGIRLVAPGIGERVAVMGLGLIGLLAVQILRAQGCRVVAIDLDPKKVERARGFGAVGVLAGDGADVVGAALGASGGAGLDAVIVAASTPSSDPVSQAARMCRKRGRIVLVGVTGLALRRDEFYEKELSFQVSCSYGPGRYDPDYEGRGEDYPLGFVRWTEQRNFEAVLELMAEGRLDVSSLISRRHPFDEAPAVYAGLAAAPEALGIVLDHDPDVPAEALLARSVALPGGARDGSPRRAAADAVTVGVVGAGNYASRTLIPALVRAGVTPKALVTSGGVSATHHGGAHGFAVASSDPATVFDDPAVSLVVVATRPDSHAGYVRRSIEAGKDVFVEKPLAVTAAELDAIETAWTAAPEAARPRVMVGFNRRFAPQVRRMKALLDAVDAPKSFIMTMNAGAIPMDSWIQHESQGGRVVSEACHLIDLMRFLVGHRIESVQARGMRIDGAHDTGSDKAAVLLGFADGSVGTVHYYANGGKAFPKERIEAFAAGRVLQLDNFRKLRGYDWPGFSKMNLMKQDKGQEACIGEFVDALRSGAPSPIPMEELLEVSRATVEAADAIREGGS